MGNDGAGTMAVSPGPRRARHMWLKTSLEPRPASTSVSGSSCTYVQLDPDTEVLAGLGSKEVFSHMCLALLGPGDTAIVPAPSFPIHVYSVALASGNVISLGCSQPDRFPSNVGGIAEHRYPRPKV